MRRSMDCNDDEAGEVNCDDDEEGKPEMERTEPAAADV